ncbi:AraC family transcriptional regulator [Lutibacter sp. TH_r2]|uniref:AraC family transcriptional regulator n=1 Tax=Lutibacter sp. TH_r2 TaxID=3082083 RepID=UPI002953CBA2|nr:AraC family transcriptional regulator [Lutibacter sp. TH_r2]MDV7185950.1 AraC family transcriptional regulator [Lutibacter sp. TH_r2]
MLKAQFEKVSPAKNSSLHAFIYEDETFGAPWHFHPEFELTYIVKGEGIRYVGNNVEKFEAGDFVLLGSNLPHCWKDSAQNKGTVKSIVFQWDNNLLGKDWINKSEFQGIKELLQKGSLGIKFSNKVSKNTFEKLTNLLTQEPFKKLIGFINLLDSLSSVNDSKNLTSINFTPNLNIKTNNRIDKVYNFVEQNYAKKIKLKDVSNLVSMGEEAFCRFFKKSLNKSFFTFVNEYRINLACKMLIETNKQVSQIAYDCGYESLPFFYRQFQKFMNCSPLVFKKNYLIVK